MNPYASPRPVEGPPDDAVAQAADQRATRYAALRWMRDGWGLAFFAALFWLVVSGSSAFDLAVTIMATHLVIAATALVVIGQVLTLRRGRWRRSTGCSAAIAVAASIAAAGLATIVHAAGGHTGVHRSAAVSIAAAWLLSQATAGLLSTGRPTRPGGLVGAAVVLGVSAGGMWGRAASLAGSNRIWAMSWMSSGVMLAGGSMVLMAIAAHLTRRSMRNDLRE